MMVWYVHKSTEGGVTQAANILWKENCPMRAGEFPPEHPCLVRTHSSTAVPAMRYLSLRHQFIQPLSGARLFGCGRSVAVLRPLAVLRGRCPIPTV